MRKNYEKPVLNASMTGTLEGVYAYGNNLNFGQPSKKSSGNDGGNDGGNGGKVKKSDHWYNRLCC